MMFVIIVFVYRGNGGFSFYSKKNKVIRVRMKEIRLFIDGIIMFVENLRVYRLLELLGN